MQDLGGEESAVNEDLYSKYHDWKAWKKLFELTAEQAGYFAGELNDLAVSEAKVLEIGFGSGSCLSWMKKHGAELYGCEISEASRVAASKYGITLISSDIPKVAQDFAGQFDTILAFDVFEHLSIMEVKAYLLACEIMLCEGGKLLLRFPNAQSPFGLRSQFGDPTHRSALSRSVIELLIAGQRLSVVRYGPSFYYPGIGWLKWLQGKIRVAAQRLITQMINWVYGTSIPYEPVVVIVLAKAESRYLE